MAPVSHLRYAAPVPTLRPPPTLGAPIWEQVGSSCSGEDSLGDAQPLAFGAVEAESFYVTGQVPVGNFVCPALGSEAVTGWDGGWVGPAEDFLGQCNHSRPPTPAPGWPGQGWARAMEKAPVLAALWWVQRPEGDKLHFNVASDIFRMLWTLSV